MFYILNVQLQCKNIFINKIYVQIYIYLLPIQKEEEKKHLSGYLTNTHPAEIKYTKFGFSGGSFWQWALWVVLKGDPSFSLVCNTIYVVV